MVEALVGRDAMGSTDRVVSHQPEPGRRKPDLLRGRYIQTDPDLQTRRHRIHRRQSTRSGFIGAQRHMDGLLSAVRSPNDSAILRFSLLHPVLLMDDDGRVIHSPYLDLAIGLGVIFFLCSLVVSGLNEGLNWLTRVRAKFLWAYLHDLFDGNRDKALPQGWGGIANLWGKRNDVRPDVGTASLGRPTTPADWLHEVVAALDPIDAPQLRRESKSGPRRTSIHHVPSPSLAQAIVEVLTDVGRDDVLHSVATVLDPKASDAEAATSIATLAALIDATAAATVTAAMGAFRTAVLKASNLADDARRTALAAPAEELVTQLRTLVVGNALVGLPTAWVDCASAGTNASDGQRRAATDALMHAFPGNFARQRIENALASLGGNTPLYRTMRRLGVRRGKPRCIPHRPRGLFRRRDATTEWLLPALDPHCDVRTGDPGCRRGAGRHLRGDTRPLAQSRRSRPTRARSRSVGQHPKHGRDSAIGHGEPTR